MSSTSTARLLCIAGLLCLNVACGDDGGITPINNDTGDTNNDIIVDVPENASLKHVAPSCEPSELVCTGTLTLNSASRLLSVKLVDGEGQPVASSIVKFEIKASDAMGTVLTAANGSTDASGIATTELKPGADTGAVRVVASVDDPNVNPVEFLISVNSKSAGDYIIEFEPVGNFNASKVDVLFYNKDVSCDELRTSLAADRDGNPATSPTPYTADLRMPPSAVEPDGRYNPVLRPNVANGESFTVLAKVRGAADDRVEVALGCKDNNPAVTSGQAVTVVVPVIKHIPILTGQYDVIQEFDITETLPQNVQTIINLIGTLTTNPGAFLVGCEANDNNCSAGSEGIIDVIIDVLPMSGVLGQLRDAIEGFIGSNLARSIVREQVNELFEEAIRDGTIPGAVGTGINITADIYNTLKKFRVKGVLEIKEQPTYVYEGSGLPSVDLMGQTIATWSYPDEESSNEHRWTNAYFFWTKDCPAGAPADCGIREVGINNFGTAGSGNNQFVIGYWDGTVLDGNKLQVNQHSLTLNYGALLLEVIEKVVLPSVFTGAAADGSPVDSIEEVLGEFIDCQALAMRVGTAESVIENLCQQLIAQGSDAVRKYVSETLVAQGDDNFLISTPTDNSCTLLSPAQYPGTWAPYEPLPLVESMGLEAEADRCAWNIDLKFSDGGNVTNLPGSFYSTGVRR